MADDVLGLRSGDAGANLPESACRNSLETDILTEWEPDIRRAARRRSGLLSHHVDADDLAQEARIRLLSVVRQRHGNAPERYTRKVIANAVLAAACRNPRLPGEEALDGHGEIASRESPGADTFMVDKVRRWADRLPVQLKTTYRVLYLESHSQREAALVLGVSQPRVAQLNRVLLARGRAALAALAPQAA